MDGKLLVDFLDVLIERATDLVHLVLIGIGVWAFVLALPDHGVLAVALLAWVFVWFLRALVMPPLDGDQQRQTTNR